ncbi:MAG: response regulator [Gemmatimonadota bacterium]
MTQSPIRIVVADDHALVREGIRHVLDDVEGFEVVAEAGNGREALESVENTDPDVVLLDLTMPGLGGLEVTSRLRASSELPRVLILSMHDETEYVLRAVRAGADGYLLKDDAGPEMLRDAVAAVHAGDSFFSPRAAAALALSVRTVEEKGAPQPLESLTGREIDVLRLLASGQSNKQMASELGISRRTVESHRESLMRKLRIRTVAGLTRLALEQGLLQAE